MSISEFEADCAAMCSWCADPTKRRATIREHSAQQPDGRRVGWGKFYHFASGMMVRYCEATPLRLGHEQLFPLDHTKDTVDAIR